MNDNNDLDIDALIRSREEDKKTLLEVFRRAIPEISDGADIIRTKSRSIRIDGSVIELKDYDVPGPDGTGYKFTIARLDLPSHSERDIVFVLDLEIEGGTCMAFQYKNARDDNE